MTKNKILVFGNFGYINSQVCGQTIKTRNIYELFKLKMGDNSSVEYFNTQQFQYSLFFIFNMLSKIYKCNKLVYIPAQNNLKYLFPLLYLLCRIKRCEILYFVVGGWIGDFLKTKKIHIALLSRIRAILSESSILTKTLISEYHFKNVITFPNFRIHSFVPDPLVHHNIFRIVFMSRINRMKGIDYVFKIANNFNKLQNPNRPVIIDFYGPIEIEDKYYFFDNISKYSNVSYKGILQPENIYNTINKYDLMIFPTRYFTEGFPGTILDAYIAGLPIVATNWKYAHDFIRQGKTGLIVPFDNSEDEFVQAVIKLYEDSELLLEMKKNAFKQSIDFSAESAWKILLQNNLIFQHDKRI